MTIFDEVRPQRHPRCEGYTVETPNGTEYECGYDTVIECQDCKYCGGRKDPAAKCNSKENHRA